MDSDSGRHREALVEDLRSEGLDPDERTVASIQNWGGMLWGGENNLKWTLLLAFKGGFYQSNLKYYYPDNDESKGRRHRDELEDNMLAVQISERKFAAENLEPVAEWLAERRTDGDAPKREFLCDSYVSIGDPVGDAEIMRLIDGLESDGSGTEAVAEQPEQNPPNKHKWIFLTPLGEEFLQSIYDGESSFRVPAHIADDVRAFLKALPKVTRLGGSRYVPDIYRLGCEGVEVTDCADFDRNRNAFEEIRETIVETIENAETVDIIAPWKPSNGMGRVLADSDADIRFIMDAAFSKKYREKKRAREWVNQNLLGHDATEPMLTADRPENITLRQLETRSPYLFIRTSTAGGDGRLLFRGVGDPDTDEKPMLVRADETADAEASLYEWGETLYEEIYQEASPPADIDQD